jgi:murein DD-endopeptidase MepM/ murein hydrolase activator NlpD
MPPVLRPFRAPESAYGAGHRGLDLGAADAVLVLAVEEGVVTHAGSVAGRGTVTLAHPGGLSSTYEPVVPIVSVGSVLATGDPIGTLQARAGPRHCGERACLHLGARRGAAYLDPWPLLAGGRVALLALR